MMRRGLTLIETVISVGVVSILLAGALNTAGAAAATRTLTNDRRIGEELCQAMMAEILSQPFLDPTTDRDDLAPEAGEIDTNRTKFDDIGDYHLWSASPPVQRDGSAISGTTGLTREVEVTRYINESRSDLFRYSGQVKVVRVRVLRGNRLVSQLIQLRVQDWDARERQR